MHDGLNQVLLVWHVQGDLVRPFREQLPQKVSSVRGYLEYCKVSRLRQLILV